MIERADQELKAWLEPLLGTAALRFDLPAAANDSAPSAAATAVSAYLFDVDRPPTVASTRTPPIELRLGYLIWVEAGDPLAAHALLGSLIVAAVAQPQFELAFGAPVAAAWSALDRPAQPAFLLYTRVAHDRGIPLAPPVRVAPRIEGVTLSTLRGRVAASDGTPIVDAVIEIGALARSATCDTNGAFEFAGIPKSLDVALHVRAKGREIDVERPAKSADEDLLITVPV